jgi:hypothetical protein
MEDCPKSGLHNSFKSPERYIQYGEVCFKTAALMKQVFYSFCRQPRPLESSSTIFSSFHRYCLIMFITLFMKGLDVMCFGFLRMYRFRKNHHKRLTITYFFIFNKIFIVLNLYIKILIYFITSK